MNRLNRCAFFFLLSSQLFLAACGDDDSVTRPDESLVKASIVGTVEGGAALAGSACPDLAVTVNGQLVDVLFEDDCVFLIQEISPAGQVVVGIAMPDHDVSGSIVLDDVREGEQIDIRVRVDSGLLVISVLRRTAPGPVDEFPAFVGQNNVSILLPAGVFEQDLTIGGNNFNLVGRAGHDCDDGDWTVLDGRLVVEGNNATFKNIAFTGPVEVRGRNARFIHCCIGDAFIRFDDRGHGHDDDDDDD